MNSRDRVLRAFEHTESDEIPIDFSGHRCSGIAAIAYAKLRDHLGLPRRPIRVYDPIQQLAIVDEDVRERFGVDTIELGRAFALHESDWQPWTLPDGTPCLLPAWVKIIRGAGEWKLLSESGKTLAVMPDGALYFDQVSFPFAEADDLCSISEALSESMWTSSITDSPPGPLAAGAEGERRLHIGASQLRATTDCAVIGLFDGNLLEMGQFLYKNDRFFLLLAEDPSRAEAFLDNVLELHLLNLKRFLGAVGDFIDIVLFSDDLGMQTGPQISPAMYRTVFKPRHQKIWSEAKMLAPAGRGGDPSRPPVRVMLHSCGGVRGLLPDLIEAGLDAINPVQIGCAGMEPAGLKRDFGKDIVFWGGGCDTQRVLCSARTDEVQTHVRKQVEMMAKGGGFVFQAVHNIQADVAPENIVAMFDAVRS